jgi:hypothetical protein
MNLPLSDPATRFVLEDWLQERGRYLTLLLVGTQNGGGYDDGGYGYDDGGYGGGYGGYSGGYGYDDGGYGDGGGGYGDGGYGYDDGGYGDGGGGYGDGGDKLFPGAVFSKGQPVNHGLYIVSVPSGGYYPYTIVGWVRRVEGDEWEAVGARIIRRYGPSVSLTTLAEKGPQEGTELLPASHLPRPVHRLHMGLPLKCDVKAWAKDCPKPKGWK